MVNDFGCNEDCLRSIRWDRFNPADFVGQRCQCRLPIDVSSGGGAKIGAVADWAAEDFYTVSMEEWSKLHEIYT